jgi:outer membrane protein TolC
MDLLRNFLGAGLLTLCALGRADEPLTLSAAIAEARAHNPELLTLQARIRTVKSGVDVAKATAFNPEFSFEDGFDYRFGLRFTVEWPGKRRLREAIEKVSKR